MPKGIYKRKPRKPKELVDWDRKITRRAAKEPNQLKDPQFKWTQKSSPIVGLLNERIEKAQTDMQNSLDEAAFYPDTNENEYLKNKIRDLEAELLRIYRRACN